MSELYLSRARLRRDVPGAALRELLVPRDDGRRLSAGHKLVWTLFADGAVRTRDFLWRDTGDGQYYLLSRRLPHDQHGLFDVDPPKAFAPHLAVGDRLHFTLRANATVAKKSEGGKRGKPCDVVMDALYALPQGERGVIRREAIHVAGGRWLASQGDRHGFVVTAGATPLARVTAYRTITVDHSGPRAVLGVLDFEGALEVRDPMRFVAAIGSGFGRAKSFGCGLMLLRRPK